MGVNEVIQSEREPNKGEQAMLAAANSGIDFSTPPEDRPTKREVIEILDDEDDDISPFQGSRFRLRAKYHAQIYLNIPVPPNAEDYVTDTKCRK